MNSAPIEPVANTRGRSSSLAARLLTAALLAGVPSLALAEGWSGTWRSSYGELRLKQVGERVYGDYADEGTIEGVANGDRLRGSFQRKDGNGGYIEFQMSPKNDKFIGKWSWIGQPLPVLPQSGNDWSGWRSAATAALRQTAAGSASYSATRAAENPLFYKWAMFQGPAAHARASAPDNREVSSSFAAASAAPAAKDAFVDNEYLAGVWQVDSKGTDYGPWQPLGTNKLALQFDPADASGVMHGFVLGKPVVLLGRKVGNAGFRGIWMETVQAGVVNPTGRWGLASAQVGIAAKSIQVALSMGYRKPVPNSAGPGFPGRTLSGTYYMNANPATGLPSRGGVLKAWQKLVADAGPYPNMHGVYPDAKIDAAIQAWTRDQKLAESWGRSATVDPCAAECMGREPARIGFRITGLQPDGAGWSELFGRVAIAPTILERGKRTVKLLDKQGRWQVDILSIRREEAKKIHGRARFMMVTPPPELTPCPQQGFAAMFVLPGGLWTDPLRDIASNTSGTIVERDLTPATDDVFKPRGKLRNLKETIELWADSYIHESVDPNVDMCVKDLVNFGEGGRESRGASFRLNSHVF